MWNSENLGTDLAADAELLLQRQADWVGVSGAQMVAWSHPRDAVPIVPVAEA